jgi:hypothetical protein
MWIHYHITFFNSGKAGVEKLSANCYDNKNVVILSEAKDLLDSSGFALRMTDFAILSTSEGSFRIEGYL